MSLNKNLENIVIGFDLNTCKVKILHNAGAEHNFFDINEFVYNNEFIGEDLISDLLSNALGSYLKNKKFELPDVYIVLPDNLINIETLTIPIMPENKIKEVIKTEIKKLYDDYSKYEVNNSLINKTKKQATYVITMVDKSIIMACQNVCKKFGLNLKSISFKSNSTINSILALSGKYRHSNFMFINLEDNNTQIAYASHDKLIRFLNMPFGKLDEEKKSIYDLIKQNSADFLMYNTFSGVNGNLIAFDYSNDFMKKFRQEQNGKRQDLIEKQNKVNEIIDDKPNNVQGLNMLFNYINLFSNNLQNENLGTPDIIIVNSNKDDIEDLSKYDENYKIIKASSEIPVSKDLLDNLSLYGMIYAVVYNKGHNFVDKEKQNLMGRITTYLSLLFRRFKNWLNRKLNKEKTDEVKKK